MQQLTLDIVQPAEPTLDNFVMGPNAEAVAMAKQVADGALPARTMLLWGAAGSGKTHLLRALAHARPSAHRWLEPTRKETFEEPPADHLLLADDFLSWSDESLHQLFHLLNLLRSRPDVMIILTATQPPAGLALRDDLRTRLAAGLVMNLALLSDDDKRLALQQHASARGHKDISPVSNWLLIHRDRDIRRLLTYLDALDQYALQTQRSITVRLLHEFERNQLIINRA
ncbi:MAG: DnaA/Hda family protein [Burkholderiaceae bacterium]